MKTFLAVILSLQTATMTLAQQKDTTKVAPQNPSPMVETTRTHERIPQVELDGLRFTIDHVLPKPVEVFVPGRSEYARNFDLLIHFHGASFVVQHAAVKYGRDIIATTVNLGAGSRVYGNAFEDSTTFSRLLDSVVQNVEARLGHSIHVRKVILTGFSAGYGAIRKILSTPGNYARVTAVLLLDGLHASYVPEGRVLYEGGKVDSTGLAVFVKLAMDASRKNSTKQFLITHSEIFPGTYVSTTEASDFILQNLGLKRKAVLKWGPLGTQQLSVARQHHFEVLGFAGNTAPDHVDHLHGLVHFLKILTKL